MPPCELFSLKQDSECADCCLREARPLAASGQPEWSSVLLTIRNMQCARGGRLYEEGQAGIELYSLRSGLVKLVHHMPNGKERVVRLLRGGDVAGIEILRHPSYHHTAIALEPVDFCRINKASVVDLDRHPDVHAALMDRWERNLDIADWWITQLSPGAVDARLARLIRFLKQGDRDSPAHQVRLPHRDDMASMLGVATETLCRAMSGFQVKGVLRRIDNSLFEFDEKAIEKIAEDWR